MGRAKGLRSDKGETLVYPFNPRRRRSWAEEMPPSFFSLDRDRSMIARNLRFVLSDTVSPSVFRIGTTAATGFPALVTMIGPFLALSAYSERGAEACLSSTFFIALQSPYLFSPDFRLLSQRPIRIPWARALREHHNTPLSSQCEAPKGR